jgi:hypothetical protein
MRTFGWIIVALATVAFGLSFLAETRLAPVLGAGLLLAAIAYATWMNQSASRANYAKAERATHRQRERGTRE